MRLKALLGLLIFCVAFLGAAPSEVTLQNGLNEYEGCIDSYINKKSADANYGESEVLMVQDAATECCKKKMDTTLAHTVINFNLSSLPKDASVQKAILSLYIGGCCNCDKDTCDKKNCDKDTCDKKNCDKDTCDECNGCCKMKNGPKKLYPLSAEWDEKSVTWNAPWATPGGDFNATSASANTGTVKKGWEEFEIDASSLQGMIQNAESNRGFLIKFDKAGFSVKYCSSEAKKDSLRPKLYISYNSIIQGKNTSISNNSARKGMKSAGVVKSGMLYVSLDNQAQISLTDLQGRTLYRFAATPAQKQYPMPAALTKGTFLMKIETSQLSSFSKVFIIE